MNPISDTVVSYGLRDSNIQRERANAYLPAADLVDAKKERAVALGLGAAATASRQARVDWGTKRPALDAIMEAAICARMKGSDSTYSAP